MPLLMCRGRLLRLGDDERLLRMLHDQHGAGRMPHDSLGDAAREHVLDEAELMLAHHDELDAQLAGARDDRVGGARDAARAQQILGLRRSLFLGRQQL